MARKNGKSPRTPERSGGGLDEWRLRSKAITDVVLPTGMVVDLKPMRLEELASIDALPEMLQHVAIMHHSGTFGEELAKHARAKDLDGGQELIDANSALVNRLVRAAIVGPAQLVADLAELDPDDPLEFIEGFDKEMIAEIVQRIRSTDATGRSVYGAQPLPEFPGADSE